MDKPTIEEQIELLKSMVRSSELWLNDKDWKSYDAAIASLQERESLLAELDKANQTLREYAAAPPHLKAIQELKEAKELLEDVAEEVLEMRKGNPHQVRNYKAMNENGPNAHGFHLLPCPFCGTLPMWINEAIEDSHYHIKCPTCRIVVKEDRRDKAAGVWNNRPELSTLQAENERLKQDNWKLKIATGNSLQTIEDVETAAIQAREAELRTAVEERKQNKLITVKDEQRMIPLRDIAFGQVEACDWFLSLLSPKPTEGDKRPSAYDSNAVAKYLKKKPQ